MFNNVLCVYSRKNRANKYSTSKTITKIYSARYFCFHF
jgi:hypothetical protein